MHLLGPAQNRPLFRAGLGVELPHGRDERLGGIVEGEHVHLLIDLGHASSNEDFQGEVVDVGEPPEDQLIEEVAMVKDEVRPVLPEDVVRIGRSNALEIGAGWADDIGQKALGAG